MTNKELITELRGHILSVPLTLLHDAADALEAADKRVADLETALAACRARKGEQLPKEGEWIEDEYGYIHCSKCQNCIFRKFGADHWKCEIQAFELRNILANKEAKSKNHGFI